MEIFKITRKDGVSQVDVGTANGSTGIREEEAFVDSEANELRQAKALTGDVETVKTKPAEQGTVADNGEQGEPGFTLNSEPATQVMVKIDGPLSQVFTESLNKVLAYENMIMLPLLAEEYEKLKDAPEYNETITINVQAYDANEMSTGDVVDISNEITKTTQEDHILVMEAAYGVGKATQIAESMCRALKTATYVRLNTAAVRVADLAKKAGV